MSLPSFCNKLFKNENPEDLDIKMKFRFKNKNMEDKDLFEILLVIFMYGLMTKYFKNKDEINLEIRNRFPVIIKVDNKYKYSPF